MLELLSFVFYLFLGFWLFGLISRWALRFWLLRKQRQMEEQMKSGGYSGGRGPFQGGFFSFGPGGARFGGFSPGSGGAPADSNKKEGEVTVEQPQHSAPSVNKQVGEYVDFEEIADTKS